jgi:mono/diheme cytochrome c family protein
MASVLRVVCIAFLVVAAVPGAVAAQDALRGKRLYLDAAGVVGSEVSCVDCHGGLPGGLFGISRAANDPARVENAVNTIPQMTPLRGFLRDADFADLAAYLGNPAVASPQVLLTLELPGAATAADRLEFGSVRDGAQSAAAQVQLSNAGLLPFTITAAPALAGTHASEFVIESLTPSSACTVGQIMQPAQSCGFALRFRPLGGNGSRSARVRIGHDWVGGGVAAALLGVVGEVGDDETPPEDEAEAAQGCSSSRGGEPGLLLLCGLWFGVSAGRARRARGRRG